MSYVDGFVVPVRNADRERYREVAARAAVVFKDCGALRVVECWGDDVPEGKLTSFTMSVKREDDEAVVFSWIEWPDKATRDSGMKKAMEDPRMGQAQDMPFDGKRMIFGGFVPIVDA